MRYYSGQPHVVINNRKVMHADSLDEAVSCEKAWKGLGADVSRDYIDGRWEIVAVFDPFKKR